MNLEELRQQIDSGKFNLDIEPSIIIDQGHLKSSSNNQVDYVVTHGWNILSSKECDELWTKSNIDFFEFIENQNYSEVELNKILESLQIQDSHWDWFAKSYAMSGNEYVWFYLYANKIPQGACVIFQPKTSGIHDSNIFYVEFIAVAPWNRDCKIRPRKFSGIGTILLKAALKYSVEELKLTPGFSLHSLPQAKPYYEKLKMINIAKLNKQNLIYFELPQLEANKLMVES